MTEAQIQLQNALTTTFLANLVFLSEYDKELYHRVDELSRLIENGDYKEKYALEFLMENGEFDIYDIINDKYLYNKKPKKINNELVKKVNLDSKNSIINFSEYYSFNNTMNIEKDYFDLNYLEELSSITINDAQEYKNIVGKAVLANKSLKEIRKFIFFGTLLGRHIPRIAEKINASAYLVLERNLEIFRLSLFTVDYTILGNKGVIFSIMDNLKDEEQKINKFLNINLLDNNIIKISSTNINIDRYIDNVLSISSTLSPESYDYNRMLYTHINRTTYYINNQYKFILFKKIKSYSKFFENIPILYIAAGPSLDENLTWIKENQNKFFIVTIGAAYKKLLNNNIHIDLITTVDEQLDILDTKQFDDESVSNISDNTIIFASTLTNKKIINKFNKDNLFLFEVFSTVHKDSLAYGGFSVGEVTLEILLQLNAKNIYLIGLDLALNQKTGDSHSKDSASGTIKLNLDEKQNRETFQMRASLIKVKGNYKNNVYTTPLFYSSIKSVEDKIFSKDKNVIIYNLSRNGAFFEGSIPKRINSIKIDYFNNISKNTFHFKNILNKYSRKGLLKMTEKDLSKEIKFFEENIEEILKSIENKHFDSFEDLLLNILNIGELLRNKQYFYFDLLLYNYLNTHMPYLLYVFNDKKIRFKIKKINEVKDIFLKQLREISKNYRTCLKRVVY
ncbi:motility associated factor glycosyltransferase family protein [Aliarcobacter butzleri]|uniref:motility associated factor glycosyltransferase family protein n=1 Tax=Aliarcobacter butzleri TaxID=28197 RepID=UPI002B247987|nr:6-hydroxymethylpterin diphosphokinase MptE-like protein [Aliarcobacter butzleri]